VLEREHAILIAIDCACDLSSQVELSGMFSAERDEIAGKYQVVTDEDAHADGDLDCHRLVVRGSKTEGRGELAIPSPREVEDPEEDGTVPLDGVGLLTDRKATLLELSPDYRDEIDVAHRLPAPRRCRRLDPLELLSGYFHGS